MKYKVKVMDMDKYYWNIICEADKVEDVRNSLSPYMMKVGVIHRTELDRSKLGRTIGNIRMIACSYAGDVLRGRFA